VTDSRATADRDRNGDLTASSVRWTLQFPHGGNRWGPRLPGRGAVHMEESEPGRPCDRPALGAQRRSPVQEPWIVMSVGATLRLMFYTGLVIALILLLLLGNRTPEPTPTPTSSETTAPAQP